MVYYSMENSNLFIREIEENDIELIRIWRNQEHIRKYFINNHRLTKKQQQEWFEKYKKKNDDIMFIVEEKMHFQSAIGTVSLYDINSGGNSVEFGRLMIGHIPALGKGFGKQATILACKYAFEILNISEIYLHVLCNNIKAIKLYTNVGFIIKSMNLHELHMVLNREGFFELRST